jgi:Ca2+/H+ antiporter
METSLFIFLCLLTFHLFAALVANITSYDDNPKKYLALFTGVIWSLSVFTRGEAILIGIYPLALVIAIKHRRKMEHRSGQHNSQEKEGVRNTQHTKNRRAFPNRKVSITVLTFFIVGCVVVSFPLLAWLYKESGQLIPLTLKAKEDQAKSGYLVTFSMTQLRAI